MATAITVTSITRATVQQTETLGDVAGNTFVNDGRTLLWYRNANVTQRTLTLTTSKTIGPDALAVADPVVTVLASSDWVPLGYFDPDVYGTTVTVTPNSTDVRLKAWKMG